MHENCLSNSSTQKVGGVAFERSGACRKSVSTAANPVLTELRLQMESHGFIFSTSTAWEEQVMCNGAALMVIISLSDREVIDHLKGDALIEEVPGDKEQ